MTSQDHSTPNDTHDKAQHPALTQPTNKASNNELGNPKNKRKKVLTVILGTASVVIVATAAWHFLWGRYSESTDNAYVQGDLINVSSQITGDVKSVMADDNQTVKAGQPLIELDNTDAQVLLSQAQAQLSETIRSVRSLYDKVHIDQAGQEARQADIRRAEQENARLTSESLRLKSELARRKTAFNKGAVSAEELESAQSAWTQIQAQLAAAQASLAQARAGFTQAKATLASSMNQTRDTEIANHPQVEEAIARVRQAWINLQRCTIVAPIDGQVSRRNVQPGSRIMAGAPLMTVVPLQAVWVDANFKESQLERIRINQPVELHADLYGSSMTFRGKVSGLSAGTGSAFSMLPAQNATGNWIKIVQRLPVRIEINADDLKKAPLRVGLSMNVKVDTHNVEGPLMTNPQEQTVRKTVIFDNLSNQADQYIQKLLDQELHAS